MFECFVHVTFSVCVCQQQNDSVCCHRLYFKHQLKELTSLFNEMTSLVVLLTSDTSDQAASTRMRSKYFTLQAFHGHIFYLVCPPFLQMAICLTCFPLQLTPVMFTPLLSSLSPLFTLLLQTPTSLKVKTTHQVCIRHGKSDQERIFI